MPGGLCGQTSKDAFLRKEEASTPQWGLWVEKGLIEEIRPLVDPRDVRTETLGGALEGVSLEGGANRKDVAGSGEEQRSAFSGCSFGRF